MFKILKENIIIDIIEEPIWVTNHPKNKILILTQQQFARGVVSSDGEIIFHLEGTPKEGFEDYTTVSIVEITEEEAAELKAILEGSEEELINQLQETMEEVPEEQILPRVPLMELQAKYELLAKRLEALEEENRRLREQE